MTEFEFDVFSDFRGTVCPMNFVKVKLALAKMSSGQVLKVLLDDGEPIDNVPRSVAGEEHEILGQAKIEDHWALFIKKTSSS